MKTRTQILDKVLGGFRTVYQEAKAEGDTKTMKAVMNRIKHDPKAIEAVTR